MQTFDGITETTLRLSVFAGLFIALALLELVRPRRRLLASKAQRWLTNLSIVGLGIMVGRGLGFIVQSLTAVGAALLVAQNDWGLLNQVAWPAWVEIVLAVVVLDFAIWLGLPPSKWSEPMYGSRPLEDGRCRRKDTSQKRLLPSCAKSMFWFRRGKQLSTRCARLA